MSLSTTVTNALDERTGGVISFKIHDGIAPYSIEWLHDGSAALITLNEDRTIASNVPEGDYIICVTDARGEYVSHNVSVRTTSLPTIYGYCVVHATGDTARDGQLRVLIKNTDANRFLWTSGVVTQGATLHDVAPGVYTAAPLGDEGIAVQFVHACEPAVVAPSRA